MEVVKARLLATPNTGASFQLSDEYGIVEVRVVEMTEPAATIGNPGSLCVTRDII